MNRATHIMDVLMFPGYTSNSMTPVIDSTLLHSPEKIVIFIHGHPSPLNNPLPRQKLRDHKVTYILISPIGQVTGDASPDGNV